MEQSTKKRRKGDGEESRERLQEYECNRTSFGGYVIHILLLTSVSSRSELQQEVHSEEIIAINNNKNNPH